MPPIKPGRWSWNPSLLEPRFRELARGLKVMIPSWEMQGLPYELVHAVGADPSRSDLSGASWNVGPAGPELFLNTSWVSFNEDDIPNLVTISDDWTLVIVVPNSPVDGANWSRLVAAVSDTTNGWHCGIHKAGADDYYFFHDGGEVGGLGLILPPDEPHIIYVRRAEAQEWDIGQAVIGGVIDVLDSRTNATDPNTASNRSLTLNSARDNASVDPTTVLEDRVVMIWDRALTDTELQTLSFDPFGLLRPALIETEVSGTNFTETVTDAIGVTDATTTVKAIAQAIIDAVGLTDGTSRVVSFVRTVTDAVGVADVTITSANIDFIETITDTVGVTDSVLRVVTFVRTVTDDVGVTDPVTAPKSISQTVTDAIGLTDSTSAIKSIAQTIIDAAGVTDVVSRVATFVRTITDALGVTDPVSADTTEQTYTFTPGTYNQAITGKEEHTLSRDHVSMWRHYGGMIPVGYSVLITSGVATASPGRVSPSVDDIKDADSGSGDDGRAVFTRGSTYTITSAERTILLAAGYTIT